MAGSGNDANRPPRKRLVLKMVQQQDRQGRTPIYFAKVNGWTGIAQRMERLLDLDNPHSSSDYNL